jgi:5S rRNA maturation endonuclease (ribonuclease M5)
MISSRHTAKPIFYRDLKAQFAKYRQIIIIYDFDFSGSYQTSLEKVYPDKHFLVKFISNKRMTINGKLK